MYLHSATPSVEQCNLYSSVDAEVCKKELRMHSLSSSSLQASGC